MTALLTPSTSSDITHSLEITRYPGHCKGEAYLSACGEDAWRMLFPGEGMLRDCEFVWMRYIVKHMDWGGVLVRLVDSQHGGFRQVQCLSVPAPPIPL